jgi:hypothetical protein
MGRKGQEVRSLIKRLIRNIKDFKLQEKSIKKMEKIAQGLIEQELKLKEAKSKKEKDKIRRNILHLKTQLELIIEREKLRSSKHIEKAIKGTFNFLLDKLIKKL